MTGSAILSVPNSQLLILTECCGKLLFPFIAANKPSLLLILKGSLVDKDNIQHLKNSSIPIVTWTYDSLERWPDQKSALELADYSFYVDGGDLPPGDKRAHWLPLGYDESIFSNQNISAIDCDILFVGSIKNLMYDRRRFFLRELVASRFAIEQKVTFIGTTGSRLNDWAFRFSSRSNILWKNRVPIAELAGHVSRAKICINIHQDDGLQSINPMFFAIGGAGSCQLAEKSTYFAQWLKLGSDYEEFEDSNFLESIEKLLKDDEYRLHIAKTGQITVSTHHTMTRRVENIIKTLGI
ncbi:MAG: glycosyltransferase [Geobacteraceae bacterium]|nr:glycosyltransferase [Geobacteraceae bacterium]